MREFPRISIAESKEEVVERHSNIFEKQSALSLLSIILSPQKPVTFDRSSGTLTAMEVGVPSLANTFHWHMPTIQPRHFSFRATTSYRLLCLGDAILRGGTSRRDAGGRITALTGSAAGSCATIWPPCRQRYRPEGSLAGSAWTQLAPCSDRMHCGRGH